MTSNDVTGQNNLKLLKSFQKISGGEVFAPPHPQQDYGAFKTRDVSVAY